MLYEVLEQANQWDPRHDVRVLKSAQQQVEWELLLVIVTTVTDFMD